jgi:hypothetical protein
MFSSDAIQNQDSIQYGTSEDVSLLITFLPAFLFPRGECKVANIICAGVPLGDTPHTWFYRTVIPFLPNAAAPSYLTLCIRCPRNRRSRDNRLSRLQSADVPTRGQ